MFEFVSSIGFGKYCYLGSDICVFRSLAETGCELVVRDLGGREPKKYVLPGQNLSLSLAVSENQQSSVWLARRLHGSRTEEYRSEPREYVQWKRGEGFVLRVVPDLGGGIGLFHEFIAMNNGCLCVYAVNNAILIWNPSENRIVKQFKPDESCEIGFFFVCPFSRRLFITCERDWKHTEIYFWELDSSNSEPTLARTLNCTSILGVFRQSGSEMGAFISAYDYGFCIDTVVGKNWTSFEFDYVGWITLHPPILHGNSLYFVCDEGQCFVADLKERTVEECFNFETNVLKFLYSPFAGQIAAVTSSYDLYVANLPGLKT